MAGFPDIKTLLQAISVLRPGTVGTAPPIGAIATPEQSSSVQSAVDALKAPGSPEWSDQNFVKEFLKNKRDNPDALYGQYLSEVQMPENLPTHEKEYGLFSKLLAGTRNLLPFVDSAVGHQNLNDALKAYPYTPQARKIIAPTTVVRDSMRPEVVEEEAETNPEKILGIATGRSRMDIATKTKDSPQLSVVAHETMHAYLDKKGYPISQAAFVGDWNKAKRNNKLLTVIDQWLASSPDYVDEMNVGDLTQERFAYLAQALGGAGLQAFPKELQRHYEPIFQKKNGPQ